MIQCVITFNAPGKIYHPGQPLRAKIELSLRKPKQAQCIYANLMGVGYCKWRANKNEYEDEENYLNSKIVLSQGKSVFMPAGHHSYKIESTLPEGLPTSVEYDNNFGYIKYYVQFVIETGAGAPNEEFKEEFSVWHEYDLNLEPQLLLPVEVEEISTLKGCWRWSNRPITITARIPKSGYVPGEKIPIDINVNNKSEIPIHDLVIIFVKKIVYCLKRSTKYHETSREILNIPCNQRIPGVGVKKFQKLLEVPSVAANSFPIAKVVSHNYSIQIVAIPEGRCSDPISLAFSVKIGTVPLRAPLPNTQ